MSNAHNKIVGTRRAIVVSDLHGTPEVLEAVVRHCSYRPGSDRLIIAGDCMDIGDNARDCIGLGELYGAEFLIGNHDESIMTEWPIAEQDPSNLRYADMLMDKARWGSWKLATQADGILITHGGVSDAFGSPLWDEVGADVERFVDALNRLCMNALAEYGSREWDDGGILGAGGPLWFRPLRGTSDVLPGLRQIAGHTAPGTHVPAAQVAELAAAGFYLVDPDVRSWVYAGRSGPLPLRYGIIEGGVVRVIEESVELPERYGGWDGFRDDYERLGLSTDEPTLARYRGCMLGLAIGDALGAPVEFMSRDEIAVTFATTGGEVQDLCPWSMPAGSWTDDTEMAISTAYGTLSAIQAGAAANSAFLEQFESTNELWAASRRGHDKHRPVRGPGGTCLEATGHEHPGILEAPHNDRKGAGGVMRVAPAGLAWPHTESDAFGWGARTAATTHGHPTGYLASGFLAELIAGLVLGQDLELGIIAAKDKLTGRTGHEETLEAVELALSLSRASVNLGSGIERIGRGWAADEALAIGLFCALSEPDDFALATIASVNHGGDSDTTGAITGAIMGAKLGVEAIPVRWLTQVESREVLIILADRLHQAQWRDALGEIGAA